MSTVGDVDIKDWVRDLHLAQQANDTQHGGNHYKQFKGVEPWDVVTAWGLSYLDGTALKYIARWQRRFNEDLLLHDCRAARGAADKAQEQQATKHTQGSAHVLSPARQCVFP